MLKINRDRVRQRVSSGLMNFLAAGLEMMAVVAQRPFPPTRLHRRKQVEERCYAQICYWGGINGRFPHAGLELPPISHR